MRITLSDIIAIAFIITLHLLVLKTVPTPKESIAWISRERINRMLFQASKDESFNNCKNIASTSTNIIIWYNNKDTGNYWCGMLSPNKKIDSKTMLHSTVLRGRVYESNKRNSGSRHIQPNAYR